MKFRRFFKIITVLFIGGYFSVCGYLYFNQRALIYKADTSYASPSAVGLTQFREITLHTEDGLTNTSWYAPARPGKRTIIWFHGNAVSISKKSYYYRAALNAGYGVLALEYRGFSKNEGVLSESGVYADARAAVQYLLSKNIALDDIIFIGRSLGSGVAVQMSTEYAPFATLLLSPYSSVAAVAQERYWYIPVSLLLKDHFDSLSKAASLQAPTLIFHGSADTVIPVHHAQLLYDAINTQKELFIYEGRNHSNLSMNKIIVALQALEEKS